jgi:hypothetical protein
MRKSVLTGFVIMILLTSCKKDEIIPTHGIATIDNTTTQSQTYFIYGFLFAKAKLVTTLDNPDPDITVDSDGTYLYLQTTNLNNSFYKYGSYNDSISAISAFNSLTSFDISMWEEWAERVEPNQIWIFRTGAERYAKIRIISTLSEPRSPRDFGECTFEWVYQPDGTLTFPGK